MIKLYEHKTEHDTSTFSFKVDKEDGLRVIFVQAERTDCNKWNEKQVLTDVFVNIFELSKAYCAVDKDGKHIERYITENFVDKDSIFHELEDVSSTYSNLRIAMPTNYLFHERGVSSSSRMASDTFLPLVVDINGIDISKNFDYFDRFGSKAVKKAYDFLVNGEKIELQNDLIDTNIVENYHNDLF